MSDSVRLTGSLESRYSLVLSAAGAPDFCSLRFVCEKDEWVSVRQDVPEPVRRGEDAGVMITVMHGGGLGYAATCDLTDAGLKAAAKRARQFADCTAGRSVTDFRTIEMPASRGEYSGPAEKPWADVSLGEKFDRLRAACAAMRIDDRIVDWEASVWHTDFRTLLLTSTGGRVAQRFQYLAPSLTATANRGAESQTRSLGSLRGGCRQGGAEVLDAVGFRTAPRRIAEEALAMLEAENCPSQTCDVLLATDQMMLQIHESIGHPLELDRILGDERNYAGTSFVTPEMFGSYQYGSELLNVTFDPTRPEQFASYGYDDDGLAAAKEYIIKDGVLLRGLGGTISQARSGLAGVADSRACSWNRPPIDRMANLNIEPGDSSLDEMIAATERGVYMKTNRSWSIDDSRNKFQFGCEWGQLIENGKLTKLVKNPNYRGVSATFWRNLRQVGDAETVGVFGTPNCGKGEPNQSIRVGHASPACRFADVEVFGGA
jgi:predicted Zn-dependent protease